MRALIMPDSEVKSYTTFRYETRLIILSYLLGQSYFTCDFSSLAKKNQTMVSQHMKTLFETGILKYGKRETSSTASKTR
jgi:ArsR family transcriptional regulator